MPRKSIGGICGKKLIICERIISMIGNFVEIKNKNWIARILPSFELMSLALRTGTQIFCVHLKALKSYHYHPIYMVCLTVPWKQGENSSLYLKVRNIAFLSMNLKEEIIYMACYLMRLLLTKLLNNKVECVYENKDESTHFLSK